MNAFSAPFSPQTINPSYIPPFEKPLKTQPKTITKITEAEEIEDLCCICCEKLEFYALGTCNHKTMCSLCAMKRRKLYKDNQCPICKTPSESIVLVHNTSKNSQVQFESFRMEDLLCGDKPCKVYFPRGEAEKHFAIIKKGWEYRCRFCKGHDRVQRGRVQGRSTSFAKNQKFPSLAELKKHLKDAHSLQFCDVCLQNRKVFLQEQSVFTDRELEHHMQEGDKDNQIHHFLCQFCDVMFYDTDAIWQHLSSQHESCFICRRQGILDQFYPDSAALKQHFALAHFVCHHPECENSSHLVFESLPDLEMHVVETHKGSDASHLFKIEMKGHLSDLPRGPSPSLRPQPATPTAWARRK
eukprot:TRINITY_DN6052_c0_g1_i1.p1 TRINITY_DN6052_c0_g1~~TRINITY_DN6052_c0_g1_i1.p1  ORF type:complete len:355 (-),score=6.90 TRINITY_DN6052_c0_g1_i1:25-1089(-)